MGLHSPPSLIFAKLQSIIQAPSIKMTGSIAGIVPGRKTQSLLKIVPITHIYEGKGEDGFICPTHL